MTKKHPVQEIIERWPSKRDLAEDINQRVITSKRITHIAVQRWHSRRRINADYYAAILEAASERNIPLNWRELMDSRSAAQNHSGHRAA